MSEPDPPFEWLRGFRPKFDSLSKDGDRIFDLVFQLSESGRLKTVEGQSLYGTYIVDAVKWLQEVYFARGLYDLIEAEHAVSRERAIGWPHPGTMEVAERFVALGDAARAIRIWRVHLSLIKDAYWQLIAHRNKGFKPLKGYMEPVENQRRDFEEFVASIPEQKTLLLEVLRGARTFFVSAGASATEIERLDRNIADVLAEKRRLPEGRPDARAMTEDVFWEVIGNRADGSLAERLEALPLRIARFKPKAIKDFDKLLRLKWGEAYRTDIWALAFLLRGGCSDDSFMDFRAWLIMQGRDVFERAMADPNQFDVSLFTEDSSGCMTILEAASIAYDLRAGKAMPRSKVKSPELTGPEMDEDEFASHLPSIAEAVRR